jgi:DNA-binding NarL/FixJ family response regulator
MKKISIIIADDHHLIRRGIGDLLSACEDMEIVAEAHNGEQALHLALNLKADIMLLDLNMPLLNGIEVSSRVRQEGSRLPILALTMHNESAYIKAALQAGVNGYILKNTTFEELSLAIRKVARRENFFSFDVTQTAINYMMGRSRKSDESHGMIEHLTGREKEVLQLILRQLGNKEIADELKISIKTVETHKRNLIEKTESKNIVGLIIYALNHELF